MKLGLVGSAISFTPPLDQQSALESVPEVVKRWLDDYVAMAKVMRPFSASTCEVRMCVYVSICITYVFSVGSHIIQYDNWNKPG